MTSVRYSRSCVQDLIHTAYHLPNSTYSTTSYAGVAQPGRGAGPALAGPILINTELKNVYNYISFLNPKEVAVYVQCITT